MSMTKFQDIASQAIQNACTNGGSFTAVVEILSVDAKAPTLIFKLENVLIDSCQVARGSDSSALARGGTGGRPLEEFTISFTKWGWSRGAVPPMITGVVAGAVHLGRAVLRAIALP
jgi:type VI protein secretion system component Hcp